MAHASKTYSVNMQMHRSARQRLCAAMLKRGCSGVALLRGSSQPMKDETDHELPFRQNSWFNYLFGVKEPDFFGLLEIGSNKAVLFVPRLPASYEIWCGRIIPCEEFKAMYQVDEVKYVDELEQHLVSFFALHPATTKCFVLNGINSDSGTHTVPFVFPFESSLISVFKDDSSVLFDVLSAQRVVKSAEEIDLMHYCALVSSNAHVTVMKNAKPDIFEYELEAWFLFDIYRVGGCRFTPYTCICACGPNAATLHYGHAAFPNSRQVLAGEMALLDMGAAYHGYASDITCSFPISGVFTDDQRAVYEGVLAAQEAVIDMMRPGVLWPDCHRAAEREIVAALVKVGVLCGETDAIIRAGVGALFFPHGLGHLIGCDTHDVGGYLPDCPSRSLLPGLCKLRTSRVLEAGMTLTVEPGCYFIDALLRAALENPEQKAFIDASVLQRFRRFGGVRLEDVVLVTAEGARNLTTCPRTVAEVEGVMNGSLMWPPAIDTAPRLRRSWGSLAEDGRSIVELALVLSNPR